MQQDGSNNQEGRMMKQCCIRLGMHSLVPHFHHSAVLSLPAVLLHSFFFLLTTKGADQSTLFTLISLDDLVFSVPVLTVVSSLVNNMYSFLLKNSCFSLLIQK